jgi:hypothetical protein
MPEQAAPEASKPRGPRGRAGNTFVDIFTDGACSGNPGPGGWGAVLRYRGHEKELYGGEAGKTTNNRMELMAAIQALESLKRPAPVRLHTDSTGAGSRVTRATRVTSVPTRSPTAAWPRPRVPRPAALCDPRPGLRGTRSQGCYPSCVPGHSGMMSVWSFPSMT